MARMNRVRGPRDRTLAAPSLRFEMLECRRPLHAGQGDDEACFVPAVLSAVPGDVVPPLGAEPLHSLSSIPALNSYPQAPVDIYLDFDGNYEESWGAWQNITTPAYSRDSDYGSFSDSELLAIQDIWAQVAEDFAPFNVNVTTVEPPSFADGVAMRVCIGGTGDWYGSLVGGVGYVDSFTNWIANTVYVFSDNLASGNPKRVAEASSHETGHSFGLEHQSEYNVGGQKVAEYYTGANDKAPIMGNSYAATRGLWWNGPNTYGPNSIQDDMSVIARAANGFGYRPDDHGGTPETASLLSGAGGVLSADGVISTTADVDYFSFETGASEVTLTVTLPANNNLDSQLELRSANGELIASAAPADSFGATLTANLQAGSYRVVVKSQGNYGDVGQYTLTADVLVPSIQGVVFADADRDGIQDEGEQGISGATVFDDSNGNGVWDAQPQFIFKSANTPLGFPVAGSAEASIVIENMAGSIVDLNVRFSITHPRASDLLISLANPAGSYITLVASVTATGASFIDTVLDDQATTSIYDAAAPFTGRFRPLGELTSLVGMSPNGEWRLFVGDLAGNSAGIIENFSLEITSSAAEPLTTTDAMGRYLFAFAGAGVHEIRQSPVPGYVVANPARGVYEVAVDTGTEQFGLDFANVTPGVLGRTLFYDGSKFDGRTAGINAQDDLAIATDKRPYLPGGGPATFSNVSSYSGGLNGVMIDVLGLGNSFTLDDFQFRMGNSNDPDSWLPAPLPIAITVRAGAGMSGADRIELVWGANAVKNSWLQITLEGNDTWGGFNRSTGLAMSDVFYFGSRLGDTGSGMAQVFITNIIDELGARAYPAINQDVASLYDFNRDGVVNINDQLVARFNPGLLTKIDLPGPFGSPMVANAMASALGIGVRDKAEQNVRYRLPLLENPGHQLARTRSLDLAETSRFDRPLPVDREQELTPDEVSDELLEALLG